MRDWRVWTVPKPGELANYIYITAETKDEAIAEYRKQWREKWGINIYRRFIRAEAA